MFAFLTAIGFLGLILYATTFMYGVFKKEKKKKSPLLISFLVMIIGLIGLQLT
ncbi:hypothetical protein M1E11_16195 [Bacillus sp. JZ8]